MNMEKKVNDKLHSVLLSFRRKSLKELQSLSSETNLLQRFDTKFLLTVEQFLFLVEKIEKSYFAIEIDGNLISDYQSEYWDTPNRDLYFLHHRKILPRYKIRKRSYLNNGESYWELKTKSIKGQTVKTRIPSFPKDNHIPEEIFKILNEQQNKYISSEFEPVMVSKFQRLALLNVEKNERITFDWDIEFTSKGEVLKLEGLIVAEIKQKQRDRNSFFFKECRNLHLQSNNFSKYCIGTALLNPSIKQNNFKRILEKVKKWNS